MASAPPPDSPPSSPPPSTTPPPSSSSPPPSSPPPSSPLPSSPLPLSPPPSSPPPISSPPPNDTSPPPEFSPPPPTTNSSPPPTNQSSSPPNSNASPPPPPNTSPPPGSNNGNNNSPPPPPPPPPPPTPTSSRSRHSPPPPRSLGPPSSRSSSSNDSSTSSSEGRGNNTIPIVIGVVVGVGALLILAMLIYCCVGKKKKKRRLPQPEYYASDQSHAHNRPSVNYYNTSPPQHNWQSPQQHTDHHFSNLPPPPGAMQVNQGSPWAAAPQPPPPPPGHISSSEMSSNYSGPHGPPLPPPHPSVALGFTKSSFSYDELAVATGGFSQVNLLGQGGFGYVHKGVLPNGKEIAVKSLKAGSGQGDREFQAEVEIISRVHHRHLVSLVGYCIAGGQKILVYEFVPNNTLEFHLHGKGRPALDWSTRLKIAMGSARGLAYLHEDCHPRIIHRDIKAANILLDHNFEAKVADFGLAKLNSDNYTHVSTRIMGTFGYLAPEYASSGKLTEKSDVFSFGVMLLELITGRRPVDLNSDMDESLVDWARPLFQSALETGNYDEIADPRLEGDYHLQEMARMVACAGSAVRHSARRRPKMSQIVRALEGDMSLEHLNEGPKTSQGSTFSTTSGSTENENASYGADMRKFRKVALDRNEYTSSEYGHTSEYGLNTSTSSSEEVTQTTGMSSRRLSP